MDYYKEIEIKVLEHLLKEPADLCPRGMEKWEVNATLDKLEKQGYVLVAWVEGHDAEAAKVNNAGRMHLKALQHENHRERMERAAQLMKDSSERSRFGNKQLSSLTNREFLRLQKEVERLQQENNELKARIAELEAKGNRKYDKEEVVGELKFLFKESREYIEQFLEQIEGAKSKQITTIVNNYIKSNLINNTDASSKSLYDILHKHDIYDKQYQTWQSQVDWCNDGKLERKKKGKSK